MQLSLRIQSPGLDRMLAKMGPELAREVKIETGRRYAPALNRKLVENSPVKGPGRTGNLARNWMVEPDERTGAIRIVNKAGYSGWVERGTRPHRIPKSGTPGLDRKVLRWRTGGRGPISAFKVSAAGAGARGNFIFVAKVIQHPGTKAQNIVPRSITDTQANLQASAQQALNTVLARFAGSTGG